MRLRAAPAAYAGRGSGRCGNGARGADGPARIATLAGARACNPRLLKSLYWLDKARSRGLNVEKLIVDAQTITGDEARHAALVRNGLLRNLKIADGPGLLTPGNADAMRHGRSPIVTRGPYAGEPAELDHIIPFALVRELGNELANLELMPCTLNRRKGVRIGAWQLD